MEKTYFTIYTTTISSAGYYTSIQEALRKFEEAHPDLTIIGIIEPEAFHKLALDGSQ